MLAQFRTETKWSFLSVLTTQPFMEATMADSPVSTTLLKFLQPVSRRKFITSATVAFAAASIPATASSPALASAPTGQEEWKQFDAAMLNAFDPALYVERMISDKLDCFAIYRGDVRMSYRCWLSQFDQGKNCENFLAELKRRGWAYQMLPGEKFYQAEKRVRYLREREKIGVYSHVESALDGPLLADDVTGTTAFADWERQRTAGKAVM